MSDFQIFPKHIIFREGLLNFFPHDLHCQAVATISGFFRHSSRSFCHWARHVVICKFLYKCSIKSQDFKYFKKPLICSYSGLGRPKKDILAMCRDSPFKGSVSQKLRPMLLYIIRKLFLKPLSADHFYLFLLKGYAAIYV